MLEILKNPIVIGIVIFVGIYGYLYWSNKKKYEMDSSTEKKSVNIMIPGVAGILGWFIASSLFKSGTSLPVPYTTPITTPITKIMPVKIMQVQQNIPPQLNSGNAPTGSIEFHLLENNVKLPPEDVLVELAPQF